MRRWGQLLGAHLVCIVIVCWAISAQGATSVPAGTIAASCTGDYLSVELSILSVDTEHLAMGFKSNLRTGTKTGGRSTENGVPMGVTEKE